VITIEEQNVLGGLGGAVAEVLGDSCPVPVKRLGIADCFGESGPNEALLDKHRLSAAAIAADVEALVRQRDTHRLPAARPRAAASVRDQR
jgi:transketolase